MLSKAKAPIPVSAANWPREEFSSLQLDGTPADQLTIVMEVVTTRQLEDDGNVSNTGTNMAQGRNWK
jgi:hypothetical protein